MRKLFSGMFRRLAEMLEPKPFSRNAVPMHDLTEHDVGALRGFRASEEYELFLGVLDKEQTLVGEAMLGCNDTVALHVMRGQVMGIRNAASIIDRILVAEAERKKSDERSRSATQQSDDSRSAALYGSPYWDSVQR